ncbi:hypothetical protein SLEP1_g11466 [Rubroshorea leprosula]|uniref:Histone-lysine N-methyltransferase ASHH2 n=1 Tax=Rubroshorea leprosula TaxID=152421 RepID=A0AAV5IJX3_9ROSI|nr:hypothetical protein SLEP1_g11466 [Rubroshorea leprosula]
MGSSENLTSVVEPLLGADAERLSFSEAMEGAMPKQHFCSGEECNLMGCNAEGISSPDTCLGFSQDENAAQMSVNNENVDATKLKKFVCDQHGIDICNLESNQLCSENGGPPGQGNISSKDRTPGLSQAENAVGISALHCNDSKDENDVCNLQNNGKSICVLCVKVMEEKRDVLKKIENDVCCQILQSEGYEKPSEVMPVTGSPNHYMARDRDKEGKCVGSCTLLGFSEAVENSSEEKNNTQSRTETDILNQILPSWGCEVSFELISLTDELTLCSKLEEQKDGKGISCPPARGFMEEKCEVLAGTEVKLYNQMSPLEDCSFPSELIAMTSCLSNNAHQDELKDAKSVICPSVCGKVDDSFVAESYTCSPTAASRCTAMPKILSHRGDFGCEWQSNQKEDQSSRGFCLEGFTRTVETKSSDDVCVQLLPSRGCEEGVLESSNMAESLSNIILQNVGTDDKIVDGLSTNSVVKFFEGRNDDKTVINVESCPEILHVENNARNSQEDSCQLVTNYLGNESISVLCQPFDSKNESCRRLDLSDACGALGSISIVDCSGQTGNEGKDVVGADYVFETTYPTPVLSSSQRGIWKSKSGQKTLSKRVIRNRSNTGKEPHPPESISFISKVSRRKRSCSSKPARSSIWGLMGNVGPFLEQCHKPGFDEVQNQGSLKVKGGQGSRKGIKNQASKGRKKSSKKALPSTSCLCFKVKIGKDICQSYLNNMTADVVDASASVDASFCNQGTEVCQEFSLANGVRDNLGEQRTGKHLQYNKKPEKVIICQDSSVMDVKVEKRDFESTEILEKSAGDATEHCLGIPCNTVVETSRGATEKSYMDPGTSPDSEVINPVPDSQVGALHQEDLHNSVSTTSEDFASLGDVKRRKSSKRGKKVNHRSLVTASIMKPKSSKNSRGKQKTGDGFYFNENPSLSTNVDASSVSPSTKEFSIEPLNPSSENKIRFFEEATGIESGAEAKSSSSLDVSETQCSKNLIPPSNKGHQLLKGSKYCKTGNGRSEVSDSARSKKGDALRRRENQQKSACKSEVVNGLVDRIEPKLESLAEFGNGEVDDVGNTGKDIESAVEANANVVSDGAMEQWVLPDSAWVRCDDCYKWRRISVELADKLNGSCQWICTDNMDKAFADCSIPQEKSNADINAELGLSDPDEDDGHLNYKRLEYRNIAVREASVFRCINGNEFLHRRHKTQTIDEVMVCHCKPSPDGQLGCRDECLNRMLNIECVQGTCPCGDLCSNQQFQKRKYAQMQWSRCGKKGYGLKMLEDISAGHFLIEYVGEVLDMQAYEKRQKEYACMGQRHFYFMTLNGSEVIDACAKGNLGRFINHSCDPNCRTEKWMVNGEICIGLFALRDIKQAIIHSCTKQQKLYTEGEEVTFDYNYVRVFGAAAKKCHCQSPHCRGYIGGDPLNAEVIVEDDSDEEYPEPVMLKDGETWDGLEYAISRSSSFNNEEMRNAKSVIKEQEKKVNSTMVVGQLETTMETENSTNHSASSTIQLHSSAHTEDFKGNFQSSAQQVEVSQKTEDVTSEPMSSVQHGDAVKQKAMSKSSFSFKKLDPTSLTMTVGKLPSVSTDASKRSKYDKEEDRQGSSKTPVVMKISRSSNSVKKGKGSDSLTGNKVQHTANQYQVATIKPRKSVEGSSNGRFEAVEEKLNELLDADGGVSRRRDAAKGYLKLLLLTAASGDSTNGEAIQSNRELSMILDALLKTKSRTVLNDIINKNGLRMLHNIMKQYRGDFKKIPILRKLLKILEYLAVREILTLDHINGGPPCHGMESFRESMLSLTEHDDKQVHQIARSFRDKWIPKPVRKPGYKDRDECRTDHHWGLNCHKVSASQNQWPSQGVRPTETTDTQSLPATTSGTSVHEGSPSTSGVSQTNGTRIRKRKSRWDQPADPDSGSLKQEEQKVESELEKKLGSSPFPVLGEITDRDCQSLNHSQQDEVINADSAKQTVNEDVPPGFSSSQPSSLVSSHASPASTDISHPSFCHLKYPSNVFIAHPQKRFNFRLPVSYGFPLPIMQQFGSPQAESVESWVIAPGMPFHPFPPLPPFPRNKKEVPAACAGNSIRKGEAMGDGQQDDCGPATYPDANNATPTGYKQPESNIPVANTQQTYKRARDSSYDLGKKYFRQQKRKGPPWLKC